MRLIVDFGNTLQKCAIFEGKNIIASEKFEKINLTDFQQFCAPYPAIKSCILSSVIHNSDELIHWLKQKFYFIELTHLTPLPIKNNYATPKSLGKDRLAAAVGAWSLFPNQNSLSIDVGTAIKFDLINQASEYIGGSISPGISLRFQSLHNFTAKLPLVQYKNSHPLIGFDTETSILSGVLNGINSEIDGLIELYKVQFPDLKIILSGGDSIYFENNLKSNIFAVSNLVQIGLNEILIFNETNNSF
jgi:type III pantothenate kinase